MFKIYADLTKFGIVIFVLLVSIAGYLAAFSPERTLTILEFLNFVGGMYFLSSGSLALNQAQEWELDKKMPRTASRPIASGRIKPAAGVALGVIYIFIGNGLLLRVHWGCFVLGLISVALYNGLYTCRWKLKTPWAALPGAIPGALPVLMGYVGGQAAGHLTMAALYLFSVLFLWQMPHFWLLAIKYVGDYQKAGVPVLPSVFGIEATKKQIIWYGLIYIFLGSLVFLFFPLSRNAVIILILTSFLGLVLTWRYWVSNAGTRWFSLFMWVNLSIFVYLFLPVWSRWSMILGGRLAGLLTKCCVNILLI